MAVSVRTFAEDELEMVAVPASLLKIGVDQQDISLFEPRYHGRLSPQREVEISEPFAVSSALVTHGEFREFVEATGREPAHWCEVWKDGKQFFDGNLTWKSPGFEQTQRHPVIGISWDDARAYLGWLSDRNGHEYRLLSEVEFEHCARGGTTSRFFWGDDYHSHIHYAHCSLYPAPEYQSPGKFTRPIKELRPNPFGLYDIVGNVWEWVADCFAEDVLPKSQAPTAIEGTDLRAIRGGGWSSKPEFLHSGARQRDARWHNDLDIGFRVARTLSGGEVKRKSL